MSQDQIYEAVSDIALIIKRLSDAQANLLFMGRNGIELDFLEECITKLDDMTISSYKIKKDIQKAYDDKVPVTMEFPEV